MRKLFLGFTSVILLLSACTQTLNPPTGPIQPQADFWQLLGDKLDRIDTSKALKPTVAVHPLGYPVVVWQESPTISYDIYAKQWDGQK